MARKLNIIFEDESILIIDKPAGLVVNRSETIKEQTLQDQLAEYFHLGQDLGPPATPEQAHASDGGRGIGGRAGIVHRLDRETSGLLIVAKTQKAFDFLQRQFKERTIKKEYLALVHGLIKEKQGTVESRLTRIGKFGKFGIADRRSADGREAKTDYKKISNFKLRSFSLKKQISNLENLSSSFSKSRVNYLMHHACDYTLLRLYPKTGRTHQVRVHLKSIGHAVVSDSIYTPRKLLAFDLAWCPRLFLHAAQIEFTHPKSKKIVKFKSLLPKELKNAILNLEEVK